MSSSLSRSPSKRNSIPIQPLPGNDPADTVYTLRQENARVKREWETCEALLTGSQNDNRQKHTTIESLKEYTKELERLLENALGPQWKIDHDVRSPLSNSVASCTPSTPLPKPRPSTSLRHSMSSLPDRDRSSKMLQSDVLELLPEVDEEGSTPKSALRKLEGSSLADRGSELSNGRSTSLHGVRVSPSPKTPSSPRDDSLDSVGGHLHANDVVPHRIGQGSHPLFIDTAKMEALLTTMEQRAIGRQVKVSTMLAEAKGVLAM